MKDMKSMKILNLVCPPFMSFMLFMVNHLCPPSGGVLQSLIL